MAIEFNDNIHVKINRPTDFRFGPFESIAQANSLIPIAQRYHGLIFGVYTDPLDIANSDVDFFYYYDGLTDVDYLPFGGSGKPPIDGDYADQAAMIAAQANQTAQYIYYDGTFYWEYLGTTNGNITDYRLSSSPNIVEVTTAQLATLTTNSQLIPGTYYKVTDFQTIHQIRGTTDINTGPIEPMVSLALTSNTLSQEARSYTFVDDEVVIDWTSKLAENGTTPRAGNIIFRRNVTRNVSAYYDFRYVKWRRWTFPGYDWERGFVATTATDITLTLTWSANLPGTLTTYRKWEIKFPSDIVHNAGAINLTITKGATSYTKQLVRKSTLLSDWTANELRNKVGPIIYNPGIDKFVLIDGYNVGESQIGFGIARAGVAYTIGNGLRVNPDPAAYVDVTTFYYALALNQVNNVQLGPGCVNNVFFGQYIYDSQLHGYSENNTFVGNLEMSVFGGLSYNNIFHSDLSWANVQGEFRENVIWSPFRYAEIEGYSLRNTLSVGAYNFNAPTTYIWDTTILTNAWGINFTGNSVEGSIITFSGSTRSDILFEREMSSSIVGWFSNADNLAIRRRLNSEYISTFPTASDLIESLNLKTLPTPSGAVEGLGRDSVGNIVTYTPPTGGITGAGIGLSVDGSNLKLGDDVGVIYVYDETSDPGFPFWYIDFNNQVGPSYYSIRAISRDSGASSISEAQYDNGSIYLDSSHQSIAEEGNSTSSIVTTLESGVESLASNVLAACYYDIEAKYARALSEVSYNNGTVIKNMSIDIFVANNGNTFYMVVTDEVAEKGLTYALDYSTNGITDPRWIPDLGGIEAWIKSQPNYNASVAQYFTHDASGNFAWVNI